MTTDSKTDLGEIVREIDELAVFNDEAHHIHDERMAWFKSIEDIHHRMVQKDMALSLQIDVTATPRHNDGAIFVQTVSDYPLVEAIYQNVVKHPVLPDAQSREKLAEKPSAIFSERYDDYLRLGIEEWKKSSEEHAALGKKAVLFVMVDDTKNCDEVGAYLERICPDLAGAVLVIHTKKNGEISEAGSGRDKDELDRLRRQANEIDSPTSPYKAIVSVLMLKEGWDVRNVTVIVGLRAYVSEAKILPEQTLGRGLRRMYFGTDTQETVSLMGTPAFMEFVESIQSEGVDFERKPMGDGPSRRDSLLVEVDDTGEHDKDIDALDISLPRLTRRYSREFKNLEGLDPATLGNPRIALKPFSEEETREIVFKRMIGAEIDHTVRLDGTGVIDHRSVVGFFARQLLKDLRLVGGYDVLYPRVRDFMTSHLFEGSPVNLDDPQVLRNLSEPEPAKVLYDSFKKAINALTISDTGTSRIEDHIKLRDTRPFRTDHRPYLTPKKSIFNKIVGEPNAGGFELAFAAFLDNAPDIAAFAKNYLAIGFKFDYVRADGDLSNYTPDFIIRTTGGTVFIAETKGRAEIDLPQKMRRLKEWCADATAASKAIRGPEYRHLFVDQAGFEKHTPRDFAGLVKTFQEFQK